MCWVQWVFSGLLTEPLELFTKCILRRSNEQSSKILQAAAVFVSYRQRS